MSTRNMVLFDGIGSTDKASIIHSNLQTDILLQDLETGEIIAKSLHNKVILPGGSFILRKLFNINTPEVWPSYNKLLGITPPDAVAGPFEGNSSIGSEENPKVLCFCIGTNGCGSEGSQVFAVDYNSYIDEQSIIPFRYPLLTNDLNADAKMMYGGRKVDGDYVAYYFKRFSYEPKFTQIYKDGTPIEGNVNKVDADVESYVELVLTITKDECREFFVATTGIDEARFNSISLCYGYSNLYQYENNDIESYYNEVRPLTRLNIPNEYLIDATKGVNIIYHVYA